MTILGKKQMSEEDIKLNYITPVILNGWKGHITMETKITDGRINISGNIVARSKPKFADYMLYLNDGKPIAVVEAKDNNHSVSHGLQQAMTYAQMMDLPFAYSSNGDAFYEHDFFTGQERQIALEQFPTQDELVARYYAELNGGKGVSDLEKKIVSQPYYSSQSTYPPRYYQRNAVNRTVEAIARGQQRLLLVMATGTGKTYTAFQIVYRLLRSDLKKRILYLADRNILVDQTILALSASLDGEPVNFDTQGTISACGKMDDLHKRFPEDMKKSILQYAIQGKLVEQRLEEGTGAELYKQMQAEKQRLIKEGKIKKEKPLPEIAEDEIPFDIPESWRWVRFSEIMSTMSTGPFGSMLHKTDYIEKGIPLVNPANMVNGKIVPSDKMMISEATRRRLSSYILHAGMIVLGRRGEMGRCAVVTEKEDGWLCGTGSFFMEPSMSLYVYYVVSLFSSPYVKFYLGGESVGTTMSNLNHTILSKMPIPLPPLAEQRRIVAKLDEILPLCERLK